ncbi:MAG: alpha-glucoside transport system permease protein [Actinomycetota bacterium]|nr:alpha-glucoside transport system permease protein [Actinomycetota bacterium]
MSPVAPPATRKEVRAAMESGPQLTLAGRVRRNLASSTASFFAMLTAIVWTIPTFGLLVSSIRSENNIKTTGWWNWFGSPEFTLENYREVLTGGDVSLGTYFINSIVITIPAVLFPLAFGAMAAYALSWMEWKGRDWTFILIFALQIVPLQMALVPLLRLFSRGLEIGTTVVIPALELEGAQKFATVWIAHTCFALPLCVFLLHNFMSQLPRELIEAARVDGADHSRIFRSIVLPLVAPALASFGIFQFLWVWNDLLVGLIFVGSVPEVGPITVKLSEMVGTRGQDWQLLTAGAFVGMAVPLGVFLSLQRYFVRGLLAGGLKG